MAVSRLALAGRLGISCLPGSVLDGVVGIMPETRYTISYDTTPYDIPYHIPVTKAASWAECTIFWSGFSKNEKIRFSCEINQKRF